jgi:hypothetical protein
MIYKALYTCFTESFSQSFTGIGCSAGREPADFPKTVNSIIPSGEDFGQPVNVSLTKRHFTGGISSNIVSLAVLLPIWSRAVKNFFPSYSDFV